MRWPIRLLAVWAALLLPCASAAAPSAHGPITAWGDSLTLGWGVPQGQDYPTVASLLFSPPRTIENQGIGGQTSTQIAARMGALPVAATLDGGAVPADGPARVGALTINVVFDSAYGRAKVDGTLCGVQGFLETDPTGVTFIRSSPGVATPCPPASPFVPDADATARSGTAWLWLGRNGADQGHTIEGDVEAAVAWLGHERYLVASVLSAGTDSDAQLSEIAAINLRLRAAHGSHYVDVLGDLLAAGNGSTEDAADIARGIVPRSLRLDFVHLTPRGNEIVARALVAATERLGI